MTEQDKVCGVLFDAISLKERIHYKDKTDGLENLGEYGE